MGVQNSEDLRPEHDVHGGLEDRSFSFPELVICRFQPLSFQGVSRSSYDFL